METISGRVNMLSMTSGHPEILSAHFQGKEGDDPKYPKSAQFDLQGGEVCCDGVPVEIGGFFLWFLSRVGPVDAVLHWDRNSYTAAQRAEFTSEVTP